MSRIRIGRAAAGLAGLLGAALLVLAETRYRHDIRRARERVAAGGEMVDTRCGPIEYAGAGDGPPVLVVHGAGGGFDQGIDLSGPLIGGGFRVIAPSRFGYLRTPLPEDASPAAQADAHACLLDSLGVRRVAVFGASAGAPSAMQFAMRYPERTYALVLLVPASYPSHLAERSAGAMPQGASSAAIRVFDTALRSDFLYWSVLRLAPRTALRVIVGTSPDIVERADGVERARVAKVLDLLLPFSSRRLGVLNDAAITPALPRYDLESITAPTLVIGVADDLYGTFDGARFSAEHIPGARFIGFRTGGHLWVGHNGEVSSEIVSFLWEAAESA